MKFPEIDLSQMDYKISSNQTPNHSFRRIPVLTDNQVKYENRKNPSSYNLHLLTFKTLINN